MQFDAVAERRSTSASDGLLYVAAVIALVRGSRPSVSCSTQTRPCASGTASRVDECNRRAKNCFYFHAPTPSRSACRENIPYGILLGRIFLFSNWKRREYTAKPALKPNSCHAARSPPMSEKGLGCVKTPKLNLRTEISSRLLSF
jgi:hypothetical protein